MHLMPGVRPAPPCTVVPGAGADKEKRKEVRMLYLRPARHGDSPLSGGVQQAGWRRPAAKRRLLKEAIR